MRNIIIAVLVLIIGLVGFIAFALFSLNTLVNNNKDYILTQAEKSLGRDVAVEEFQVSPWDVGVRLNGFSVADDPAFSDDSFVRASSLQLNLELLPLLLREFQVEKLIIRQPVIRLIRDEKGRFNFESLGEDERADKESEQEEKKDRGLPIAASLIDIDGGEVVYEDRRTNARFQIDKLDFKVQNLSSDNPVSVNLAAAVLAEKQNFRIQGSVGPLDSVSDFGSVPLDGRIEIAGLNIGGLEELLPIIAGILPESLKAGGLLSLSANITGTPSNPIVREGVLDATQSGISFGDKFSKPQDVPLIVSTDAEIQGNAVVLENTKVKLQTLELTGSGKLGLGETPSLDIAFTSNQAELSVLQEIVPVLSSYNLSGGFKADAEVRGEFGDGKTPQINGTLTIAGASARPPQIAKQIRDLNGKVQFTGQDAKIEEATFLLGDSSIRLATGIQKFSPLAMTYNLSSPELRLLDLVKTDSPDKSLGVLKNVKSEGQIENENGSLSYKGILSSAQGVISKLNFKNLQTDISFADDVLTVYNLKLQTLDGTISGNGKYEFTKTAPQFASDLQLRNLKLKELLTSMDSTYSDRIRGRLNLDIDISGRGDKWEKIKPALKGRGRAEVVNGAVLDINIAEQALSGVTGVPGLSRFISPRVRNRYPAIFATRNTEFDKFSVPFTLSGGKIQTDDLLISADDYAVNGDGWLSFDKTVKFNAVLSLSEKLSEDIAQDSKAAKYLTDRKGRIEIPFQAFGVLPGVKPKPDISYLSELILRATIRKGTGGLKEKVLDKIVPPSGKTSEKKTTPPGSPKTGKNGLKEKLGGELRELLK